MGSIRQAAVAGQFYPDNAAELSATVKRYLAAAEMTTGGVPKAIIAPHAGYVHSGAVAATAYARISPAAGQIKRVVLLGPSHRVPLRGLALSSAEAYATPLGNIPLDRDTEHHLLELPQVQIFDDAHQHEHSLEVHLPFLQIILGDFTLVPIVVGEASPDEVADALEAVWGGPETLIVISSDLSHFENYETARGMDDATRHAIENLDPAGIGRHDACGRTPVGGILTMARRRGLEVSTVDLRNSGDTAGSKDRVVGYGSWVFVNHALRPGDEFAEKTRALLADHGGTLLHLAGASIRYGLERGRPPVVDLNQSAPELRENGASFVTLKRDGKLRGCIGSSVANQPLVKDVSEHAYAAAFKDPRFPPLTNAEIPGLSLSVSVLSTPSPMSFSDEGQLLSMLRPRIDGLIIADGGRRALFLPAVWESLTEPHAFLSQLKIKAGLSAGHWSGNFKAWRFVAIEASTDQLADPHAIWTQGD